MWARIEGGLVAELIDFDPAGKFHNSIVWVKCGPHVKAGMTYSNSVFGDAPGPGVIILAAEARARRDKLLRDVYEIGLIRLQREARSGVDVSVKIAELDAYAIMLLDVPQQDGFPKEITWPVIPV